MEHKRSINSLEKAIGMSKGSFAKWSKSSPTIENVIKIADELQISIDKLLSRADNPEVVKDETEPQHVYTDLINKYAALNAVGQQKVMNYIDDIKDAYAIDSPVHPETSATTLMSSAG